MLHSLNATHQTPLARLLLDLLLLSLLLLLPSAPVWAADQAPSRTITGNATGLSNPYGVAVLPNGTLAVASRLANSVSVYAADATGNVSPLDTIQGDSTQLSAPTGVAALPDGTLAVANLQTNVVNLYPPNADGNVAPTDQITNGIDGPAGLAWLADGSLAVANFTNGTVTVYSSADGYTAPIRTISGSGLHWPLGLAKLADGTLAVVDNYFASVSVYAADANGNATPLRTIKGGSTGLNEPHWVAQLADGTLAVSNVGTNSVTVYAADADGNVPPLRTISGPSTGLNAPVGLAVLADGMLAVSNFSGNSVTFYTPPTPTTTTLTSSLNPSTVGTSVTFTATVAAATGGPASFTRSLKKLVGAFNGGTPTGNVAFRDGATSLGTVALDGAGEATLSTSALTAGTHSITAVYAGDASYSTSTSTALSQVVNAAPVTYTVTYNGNGNTGGAAPADDSSPYASGATVTVLGNIGSLTRTGYNFTGWNTAANGSGTNYAPAAQFTINADTTLFAQWGAALTPTTTTLTSSLNPSTVGTSVTFTATVQAVTGGSSVKNLVGALTGGVPTGNVEFFDGATSRGTAAIDQAGHAYLSTSGLTQGSHSLTAVYAGDATYQTSTSTALSQVVNATPGTYTVSYNGNGNTSGTAPTDPSSPYASGATVTVLGNTGGLAKTGFTFNGWNTAANGSGTSYAPAAQFTINTNTTLHAQWSGAPTAIPTLSEWGLILLGLSLLAVVGWRQRQGYSQRG